MNVICHHLPTTTSIPLTTFLHCNLYHTYKHIKKSTQTEDGDLNVK